MGFFSCRLWKNQYRVEDVIEGAHGILTSVTLPPERYVELAEFEDQNPGNFIGAWFHTRPGQGLLLSAPSARTQAGHQAANPNAFCLIFDHTRLDSQNLGFSLHRLHSPSRLTSYEILDYQLENITLDLLAHGLVLFLRSPFPVKTLFDAIKGKNHYNLEIK